MNKIYTKTGDKGETSLVSGARAMKNDFRIETYGEVDELNSVIGLVIASLKEKANEILSSEVLLLEKIQSSLFDLGSNLACEKENRLKYKLPSLEPEDVKELESRIDLYQKDLRALKNFILPGGSLPASFSHLARTVCRRVERKLVALEREFGEELPDLSIEFINRLSDYFFSLARFINMHESVDETLWKTK